MKLEPEFALASNSMAGPYFPGHLQTLLKQSLMQLQSSEILGAAKMVKLRLTSPQQKTMTSIAYEARQEGNRPIWGT